MGDTTAEFQAQFATVDGRPPLTTIDHKVIGKPIPRREDRRLLTGNGQFSDDVSIDGQAYAVMVRASHAHAVIDSIDATTARSVPGVLAIYTGHDAAKDGLKPMPRDYTMIANRAAAAKNTGPEPMLVNHNDRDVYHSAYEMLPTDRVRFSGQLVAMVVAETLAAAKEAGDLVAIAYKPLQAVVKSRDAEKPDAPLIWPDENSNVCLEGELGNRDETESAFARARHVAKLTTDIQRVTGVPMEARAAVGTYDKETGRYTLFAGGGGVVRPQRELAEILGVEPDLVRVVAKDIGGNFGTKNSFYPEFALVVWAAKKLGRPIKWTAERSDAFLSDYQGRDLASDAELALDADGNFLAVRCRNMSNLGAYAMTTVPLRKGIGIVNGVYRIPAGHCQAVAVHTNTVPTTPYRSAGRPEAIFIIERLIDIAARQFGFDRVDLRRRNLIAPSELPYTNCIGVTYDNGEYENVMDRALLLADWQGFDARRAAARARGKLRGIGIANYIELTMGSPVERAEILVAPDNETVEVTVGTLSSGQGHETSFAQCVGEWLGVPIEKVVLIQGDTERVKAGGGSHSGRSMRMAGYVMGCAADKIIDKGKAIASHMMGVAAASIEYRDGLFTAPASNARADIFDVARYAGGQSSLPDGLGGPLVGEEEHHFKEAGFPYGAHVAEVEIDPETGSIELAGYTAVDDVGQAINPLILHGQTHGGIVQGVGQALWEEIIYDRGTGELTTASFMDYAMPRAPDLPMFICELSEVRSPSNPLGVRAGGEGGTTPALAVVTNAAVDALAEYGVVHLEMPLSSERIWRAISSAR